MVPLDLVDIAALVAVEAAIAVGTVPGHHEVFTVPRSIWVIFPSVVADVCVPAVLAVMADTIHTFTSAVVYPFVLLLDRRLDFLRRLSILFVLFCVVLGNFEGV